MLGRLVAPALTAGFSGTIAGLMAKERQQERHARCEVAGVDEDVYEEVPEAAVQTVKLAKLLRLADLGFKSQEYHNPRYSSDRSLTGTNFKLKVEKNDCVLMDIVRQAGGGTESRALPRAGPREFLHFQPDEVRAAVVNCGGLCPGLNNVIHHVVNTLERQYGVKTIYGIRGGFRGLSAAADLPVTATMQQGGSDFSPVLLTSESVKGIQHTGGTLLGSARGGLDPDKICRFLRESKVNQLYIIGGDGTHRGAYFLMQECIKRGVECAVAGIPKTIDNDIGLIDRSFGFNSAVEAARGTIRIAKAEATGFMPNTIFIVQLMGRYAGFIAAYTALCNADVDLCIVPEKPLVLGGESGCLRHLERVLAQKGHAIVVLAEGAGEDLLGQSSALIQGGGGSRELPKILDFLSKSIGDHFKREGKEVLVKSCVPSYLIRSVPANALDSYECYVLAASAVHGAMAGYTGFSTGIVNNHSVLIPIPALVEASPRSMDPHGRTLERVMAQTGQRS